MALPKWLTPIAALSAAFIALLLALTLVFNGRIPGAGFLAVRYLLAASLVLIANYMRATRPASALFKYIDVFMPLFIILFTFDSLSHLTHHVNPGDMDAALADLDLRLFGERPLQFMQEIINPLLTTVLQVCYTSYYFISIIFCLMLFFAKDHEAFELSVFGIAFGFFVSYVGYLLVPALGPRIYLDGTFEKDLLRGPLASAINDTLNLLEGENRDAFPSGHTEVVLITMAYAWSFRRRFFWLALPLVTGLIISTVYLRYHYIVDVVAGIILAPLCVLAANRLFRFLKRRMTS